MATLSKPTTHPLSDAATLSSEQLCRYARQLAESTPILPEVARRHRWSLIRRFRANARQIRLANQRFRQSLQRGDFVPPEADWIVDNYFVIEEQLQEIATDLPPGYLDELPRIAGGDPRVYRVAHEIIKRSDAAIDESMLSQFLQHYQSVAVLSIGEMWAMPIMLRLTLVEQLRQLADAMLDAQKARAAAAATIASYSEISRLELSGTKLLQIAPWVAALAEQNPTERSTQLIADLSQALRVQGWSLADLTRLHHQRNASAQLSLANIVTSMRLMGMVDWAQFVEDHSVAEQELRRDPLGVYAAMDPVSRNRYRNTVEVIAKGSKVPDEAVARAAIESAEMAPAGTPHNIQRHVGYWLVDEGRERLELKLRFRPTAAERRVRFLRRHPFLAFFGTMAVILTGILAAVLSAAAAAGGSIAFLLAVSVPAAIAFSELAVQLTNWLMTIKVPIRPLPKFELTDRLPVQHPTIVVIPCLFGSTREVDTMLERVETHYLSNGAESLNFALLTDFTDSPTESKPQDASILDHAARSLRSLNERYGREGSGPFFIFHRRREYNPAEGCWMGWERKRGKLMQFGKWLLGDDAVEFLLTAGDVSRLAAFRKPGVEPFVITLDADTQLPHGAAMQLIGTLAHPLVRPVWDEPSQRVARGYVVLQPRVAIDLRSRMSSRFAAMNSAGAGVNPYVVAASDVYQDLFGEGSFTGKGIYDLRAFEHALQDAFPENTILSHDLIEGAHTRVAMASDVEVFDGYPSRYEGDAKRIHRWVRGDWQILPWLLPSAPWLRGQRANRVNTLSKWKIFDNARRSVVPAALLLTAAMVWSMLPEAAAAITLWVCAVFAVPPILFGLWAAVHRPRQIAWRDHLRGVAVSIRQHAVLSAFDLTVLVHKAYFMGDAIVRTLYRMLISRKHRLQWQTAAAVELAGKDTFAATLLYMAASPTIAAVIAFTIAPQSRPFAYPLLLLWAVAPAIVFQLSKPRPTHVEPGGAIERGYLRRVARRTWSYFEAYATAEYNYLPPDNVQEVPETRVAARISPTNQGLYQLSAAAARDFGFISMTQLVRLWQDNWSAWLRLETHRGHYYNWYNTSDLLPLPPRYISTVDSGNFAACLLAWQTALEEMIDRPLLDTSIATGWADTLDCLVEDLRRVSYAGPEAAKPFGAEKLQRLIHAAEQNREAIERATSRIASMTAGNGSASDLLEVFQSLLAELQRTLLEPMRTIEEGIATDWLRRKFAAVRVCFSGFADDLQLISSGTEVWRQQQMGEGRVRITLSAMARWTAAAETDPAAAKAVEAAVSEAREMVAALRRMAGEAQRCFEGTDFRFLLNKKRKLFTIGYNVDTGRRDKSFYDLLCSESRLGSFVAIGKGDVPASHWFRLGRKSTYAAGEISLVSWGGTMFEYLMPPLLQRHYERSLLTATAYAAIRRQRQYAAQHGVPWGISESAFAAINVNGDYQYQSFGVPGLGLKPGLANDLVIAPYATLLAVDLVPTAATENLRRIEAIGGAGPWGFYDAIDFTPSRVPAGQTHIVVQNYMAHHHGMSILALHNCLAGGLTRKRFAKNHIVRSCDLLLQEKYPTAIARSENLAQAAAENTPPISDSSIVVRRMERLNTLRPRTMCLGNGRYSVLLTHTGAGHSQWQDLAVTRHSDLCERGATGCFFYLSRRDTGARWSATFHPLARVSDEATASFAIDKAEFRERQGDIESLLEITVSPEHDAEVRRLRLTNLGDSDVPLRVTSYAEPVLATPAADAAHPAFQKLFVRTDCSESRRAIFAQRKPRGGEREAWAAAVLAHDCAGDVQVSFTTSREDFIGRLRSLQSPVAVESAALNNRCGYVLDPAFAFQLDVTVPAGQSVTVAVSYAAAESYEQLETLIDLYSDLKTVQRSFELAWAFHQAQLRDLNIDSSQAHLYQRFASYLLAAEPALRGSADAIAANTLDQSGLWPFGVSGDRPVCTVHVVSEAEQSAVADLCRAYAYLRSMGFGFDLVLINENAGSYRDELGELLAAVQAKYNSAASHGGRIFVIPRTSLSDETRRLLAAVSAVSLHTADGPLAFHLQRAIAAEKQRIETLQKAIDRNINSLGRRSSKQPYPSRAALPEPSPVAARIQAENFDNGWGHFLSGDTGYEIDRSHIAPTPAPWSHLLANERFGTLLTESGGGYSWFGNSREFKLTGWSNDPVIDPIQEHLWIRDEESDDAFAPLADAETVRYEMGSARFLCDALGMTTQTEVWVDGEEPVKVVRIRLHNRGDLSRRITATFATGVVLADREGPQASTVVTWTDVEQSAVCAQNPYHRDFGDAVAFLTGRGDRWSCSGDRSSLRFHSGGFGPPALLCSQDLDGRVGGGFDPALAIRFERTVAPHQTETLYIVLGAARNLLEADRLIKRCSDENWLERSYVSTRELWQRRSRPLSIRTPSRAMDVMVNGWLLYQTICCRMMARTAYYQAGGAFGFRDQLQDAMAAAYAEPDRARKHLLAAASRQFEEGDVQHWWHPPSGRGTRTRFSDDLLFLPFAATHYCRLTGDNTVWHERAGYLRSPVLSPEEQERYETPLEGNRSGSLLEHCKAAVELALRRVSPRGLPLIGCGDWNDGMNLVGTGGQGESVWLGWFMIDVLRSLAAAVEQLDASDSDAERYRHAAAEIQEALHRHAWDGDWFTRAFFDDGTPLGSKRSDGCRIDALPQAWAVLVDPTNQRARIALRSALDQLVRNDQAMTQLFDPPFEAAAPDPGYVNAYPPGVRENGGQYTHAAAWLVAAAAKAGWNDEALRIFEYLTPAIHSADPTAATTYRLEPYAVAADIYWNEEHRGRGGWSWYTGAAGWLYRVAVESILGIQIEGDKLLVEPNVPPSWLGFEVELTHRGKRIRLIVHRCEDEAARATKMASEGKLAAIAGEIIDLTNLPDLSTIEIVYRGGMGTSDSRE